LQRCGSSKETHPRENFIVFENISKSLAGHRTYAAIVKAIKEKRLREPFSARDFSHACSGFADRTYRTFLHKHSRGNPGGHSELFERTAPGKFKLLRPIKYGL